MFWRNKKHTNSKNSPFKIIPIVYNRLASVLSAVTGHRHTKKLHWHLAGRPHHFLSRKSYHYHRWHSWKWHSHVHGLLLVGYVFAVGSVVVAQTSPTFAAVTAWQQSSWVNGVGESVEDQFASSANIDFSNAGSIKLDKRYSIGTFKGNQLSTGSNNLNVGTPMSMQFNNSQSFDGDNFSYDDAQPTRIIVDSAGDYFVSLTQTLNSNGGSSLRNSLISEIWVNGNKVNAGEGSSSYIRNASGHQESSNHLATLLEGLSGGDYIEIYVQSGTTESSNTLTGDLTTYVEKIESSEQVFSATSTGKTSGTDLNSAQAAMEWTDSIKDSGFAHSNSSSPQNITVANPGTYLVSVNIPLTSSSQRPNITGKILLDGSLVDGGIFQQGYIRNAESHNHSSIHWSGLVTTTSANQVLTVTAESEAVNGTVTVGSNVATLFIMSAPSVGVYSAEATQNTGGNDWAPSSAQEVSWATDNVVDGDIYSHSTSSSNHQITVQASGDYLLGFNLATSGGGQRTSPNVSVKVNGSTVTGAESLTGYLRNTSNHDSSSNTMLTPLSLTAGDVVTLSVTNDGANGTVNDDTPATMFLWKKGYYATGSVTSNIYDALYDVNWGTLNYSSSGGGDVEIKVRSDSASNMSGAPSFATCNPLNDGDDISENNCVDDGDRYVQYQATLISDGSTPSLQSITINYDAVDQTPPETNASNIQMYQSEGGSAVLAGEWTNASEPYFTWDDGADVEGGSGLGGYCLYLGQDDTANPVTTKGLLGSSPVPTNGDCQFIVAQNSVDLSEEGILGDALETSSDPYYMSIRALDTAGNVFGGELAQFEFRYDNDDPENPLFITAPSQFIADKEVELTWDTSGSAAPRDEHSGLAGLQYRIGNDGTWYGDDHSGTQDSTDLVENDGSYTTLDPIDFNRMSEGNNVVYFRTWDNAGNVSVATVKAVIKLNTVSPTPVLNVSSTPSTNTTNSFAFSWLAPASYSGSKSQLTYCYVFNALPTQTNCTFTDEGETSLSAGAYATQPGENTIYVVAKDEAGNINYAAYGFDTFTANTSAPGIPLNVEVADISVKQTSNWKIALSWEQPGDVGAGVSQYRVYRSTNGDNFNQVATTSATSYVDQGLSQQKYYYKVKACDSANNCGAQTEAIDIIPTGRYTEPAELITQPSVSNLSTRKATIEWVTGRSSDSKIAIGTEPGKYNSEEISNSEQVTLHSIQLNSLDPGTKYYYVARWTDEDGNTGKTIEKSFTTAPPPNIKNVNTLRVALTSATLEFTSTNAVAINLYYGKSEGFGGLKTINTSAAESTYNTELVGLDDGTEYFYKLNPVDADGNEYEGTILSFTTPPQPRISNLSFQPVRGAAVSTQEVTWTTNVAASSSVRYGKVGTTGSVIIQPGSTKNHKIRISNLEDDSQYFIVAESRDADGNLAVSDEQVFKTALDTRAPKLYDITFESSIKGIGTEARGQVIVSWKTDEPSTSQVAYVEGSNATVFNSRTAEETQLTTEHIVVVSDLPTSKVYSLQPVSKDKANNVGVGEQDTVIIGRASESILTTIFGTLQRIFGL